MTDDSTTEVTNRLDEQVSDELDLDEIKVKQHIRYHRDLSRMHRGEPARLGYVLIDRQDHPDAAIVLATADEAHRALEDHPLVECLVQEDCLDVYVPAALTPEALADREIFIL